MRPRAPESPRWSRRQWGAVIAGLFVLHAALILAFGAHKRVPATASPSGPKIHMVTAPLSARRIAASFFAADPTLYSSLSLHGFSGPAWLQLPPPAYALPDSPIPPRWLNIDSNELGRVAGSSIARLGAARNPEPMGGPLVESTPFLRPKEQTRPKSTVRLTGDLAARRAQLPENLPSWPLPSEPGALLVSNTVVELAADNQGEVVSARLRSKSGIRKTNKKLCLRTGKMF